MKAPVLLAVFLVAGVTSAAVSWFFTSPPPVAASSGVESEVRALAQRIDELARRVDEVANRATTTTAPAAREAVPALDPGAVDRAVRAWLAEHRSEIGGVAKGGAASSGGAPPEFGPAATATELWKLDWETQAERWQKLTKEQRAALVAHIEELAKAQPNNADIQNRLGEGYVQMLLAPGT